MGFYISTMTALPVARLLTMNTSCQKVAPLQAGSTGKAGRLTVLLLLAAFCCTLYPRNVAAFGFGGDIALGSGRLKKTASSVFGGPDTNTAFDDTRLAAGLVYDSNLGQDRLFNYRLSVHYQQMKASSAAESFDLRGVSIDNDFGFALSRSENVRLWAGPEVKLEFIEGEFRNGGNQSHSSHVAVGLAPVVGANFQLGEDLSLTLKGGYMFLEGVEIFSEWKERYGFFSIGIVQRFGGDLAPLKEGKP